ncbi:MAG: hydantoinase B/oxoprolinase family protein [Ferruginibacter sp.]|nr:hydantoinase B/oxoprolinase family protein [Cytophagales bacterium]
MEENKKAAWQVWVDTGGTFTDCLAIDPKGRLHQAKVLSNSTLRGKVLARHGEDGLRIRASWNGGSPALFAGYDFRLLNQVHPSVQIRPTNAGGNFLRLSALPEGLAWENADFEITAHEEAPILAARLVTNTPLRADLPPLAMRLGSTKGTNALLEHQGAPVGLLITAGFADLLAIGTQQRPDLFALRIEKPPGLYQQVIEVDERLDARGRIRMAITETELERIAQRVRQSGLKTWAIALMHSYLNPDHEHLLAERLRREGLTLISCSSALAPSIKILPRAETAVVNAYLSEVMERYLRAVEAKLPMGPPPGPPLREYPLRELPLRVMTSAGGLVDARVFRPKDSLLSGPAGGVVGAAGVARQSGITHLLTLDMGGTSTDVARYDGEFDYRFESRVGDAHLFGPSLAIETVAAGGGSVCRADHAKLSVGPQSAGASPGPACYGAGGPLTITDVNLLLGRLDPDSFGIPLDRVAAERAFSSLRNAFLAGVADATDEQLLEGFLDIANEKMAEAIRRTSVSKGYDPAAYTLLAFGGAGGQHAGRIAALLRIRRVLIPNQAGLLSAWGMGQARIERFATRQVLRPFSEIRGRLDALIADLSAEARAALNQEGYPAEALEIRLTSLLMRFRGQDHALEIKYQRGADAEGLFRQQYESLYGHWVEGGVPELESVKVIASTQAPVIPPPDPKGAGYFPQPKHFLRSYLAGQWHPMPVFLWEELQPGAHLNGPALVVSGHSTTVVEPGWQFDLDAANNALLTPVGLTEPDGKSETPRVRDCQSRITETRNAEKEPGAVQLELFTNRFRAVAEEMGALLQRTAFSVNVKERLDFSCALLDADGELVANAPHIPVHLGSLGVCVRAVRDALPMDPGDVVITNHPGFGGSHLPDVTLIRPVYAGEALVGYVANRAHHAEIGGRRPGSMPPDATRLAEEGVVLSPAYLVRRGVAQWDAIRALLTGGPYPSRAPAENLADLNAALASVQAGATALGKLVEAHGLGQVRQYMRALKDYTADCLQQRLARWPEGTYTAEERLDDGTRLVVQLQWKNPRLRIDFSGSGSPADRHPGNLNATPAIVHSAVMYVLRLLTQADVPLNEGMMRAVEIILPRCLLNPDFPADPFECPAVVGGNTETSQRLVDTLLKALGLVAGSQGTMNNVLFGNDRFGYYETIGGGAGAGNGFHGASAVHTHMTNTRITDPEILEFRYPVRLEQFAIRRGSGGEGTWRGGDGITREITFLEPVSLTILAQHRQTAPYGLAGGGPGSTGEQRVVRADGTPEKLDGTAGTTMEKGDRLVIHTPGGGGYGHP